MSIYFKYKLYKCLGINTIEDIIFDLGSVLIFYELETFIKECQRRKVLETIFKSKEWSDLDRGTFE